MGNTDQKVLIVDDDPVMLDMLESGLEPDREIYETLRAESAEKAIEILERVEIPLVVSDVKMPVMSGLDLLAKIRDKFPHTKVVLITADDSQKLHNDIKQSGCLHFFQKPIKMNLLRELINRELSVKEESGFAGTLNNIQLPDLIQMCCYSSISTAIRVYMENQSGTIYIEDGEIIHAECEGQEGLEAFYKVFSWRSGRFENLGDIVMPKTTIDKNWQFLLMEGHRQMDEADALAQEQESSSQETTPVQEDNTDADLMLKPDEDFDEPGEVEEQILSSEEDEFADLDPDEAEMEHIDPDEDIVLPPLDDDLDEDSLVLEFDSGETDETPPFFNSSDVLKVLIVDDSAMMCKILKDMFSNDDKIEVIGTAVNGEDALKQVDELHPDLITLDVNMPVMCGSTALKHIMIKNPCPVVIVSAMNKDATSGVLDFLLLGAVDFIQKPVRTMDMEAQQRRLLKSACHAAGAKISNFRRTRLAKNIPGKNKITEPKQSDSLVIICSGAGGYAELFKIIPVLPPDINSNILVLQEMFSSFQSPFADSLNNKSYIEVLPLQEKSLLLNSQCCLALNNVSLGLKNAGQGYYFEPEEDLSKIDFSDQMPDNILAAAADIFSDRLRVILLSGANMGTMSGLAHVKKSGGQIIAQNRDSCLVPYPIEKAAAKNLLTAEADIKEIINTIKR